MKLSYNFTTSMGHVECCLPDGQKLVLPVIAGILKHPSAKTLPTLLSSPDSARKYSVAALQKAAWPVLRQFPRDWLLQCIPIAHLRPGRERALRYLLSDSNCDSAF